MAALNECTPTGEFARVGVRGVQRMRRSQSASGIVGKVHGKVASAKDYLSRNGLAAETIAMKLLTYRAGDLGIDFQIQPQRKGFAKTGLPTKVTSKVVDMGSIAAPSKAPSQQPTDHVSALDLRVDNTVGKCTLQESSAVLPLPPSIQANRTYYCKDIFSFEEMLNLGGDHDGFDDKFLVADITSIKYYRYYYGQEIGSYEEFYNLAGGAHEYFDDECLVAPKSKSMCRCYYSKEIHSYEEFYNLVGDELGTFDDECAVATSRGCPCRHFFCREIHTYEDLYVIAGACATFDDEHA